MEEEPNEEERQRKADIEHLWQWGSLDEEQSLNRLLMESLLSPLKQWRVDLLEDLANPMLVPLCNWAVAHGLPKAIACTRIAPSTIQGAGYGLFATRRIPAEHHITVYGGAWYESKKAYTEETGKTVGDSAYVIELKKQEISRWITLLPLLDGELHFAVWEHGRWANTQRKQEDCNAVFEEIPNEETGEYYQVRLRATRDIAEGEEIFVWYSDQYLEAMFGTDATKKTRINQCIECKTPGASQQLAGYPQWMFCNQKCASHFWKNGRTTKGH